MAHVRACAADVDGYEVRKSMDTSFVVNRECSMTTSLCGGERTVWGKGSVVVATVGGTGDGGYMSKFLMGRRREEVEAEQWIEMN